MSNKSSIETHKNTKQFLTAIEHTARETGFFPNLIEKDYYCSVRLNYLSSIPKNPVIFRGGTLLAKFHAGFYRLSEDLDFTISLPKNSNRKQRSETIQPVKNIINSISGIFPELSISKELKGSNESKQYNGELTYNSIVDNKPNTILIEISLRNQITLPPVMAELKTILLNPFNNNPIVSPFEFPSLSKVEAYAEKIRGHQIEDFTDQEIF